MNESTSDDLVRRLEQLGQMMPPAEATRQALERVRRALERTPAQPVRWPTLLAGRLALTAAVLLAVGVLAWLVPPSAPAQAAFADVQAATRATRSVTGRLIHRGEGRGEESSRFILRADGRGRFEDADGNYTVMDPARHRTLIVHPQKRQATLLQGFRVPPVNLYELLKSLPADASAQRLPQTKSIDGRRAIGFRVTLQGHDVTVWADPDTRLPLRIVALEQDDKDRMSEGLLDELVFDRDLDPGLFSLEPPAGYTVKTEGIPELSPAPVDPRLRDLVVTPGVGIGPVKFRMTREQVEQLLGKPDTAAELGPRGYVDMRYASHGFFIGVGKQMGVVTIMCVAQPVMAVRVRDFAGKTDKGIGMGARLTDIIRTYGPPTTRETKKGSTYLHYSRLWADFTLFNDRLVQITLNLPRPAR